MNKNGPLLALGAYLFWGFFPLYLHLLRGVSSLEIICHRIAWSFVLVFLYLGAVGRLRASLGLVTPRLLGIYAASACCITVNWGSFVWGVATGRTLEASFGYFMSPILNVVLGLLFFGERLSRLQRAGAALAAAGVVFVFATSAAVPWIALLVAASFGAYGLIKKQAPLPATEGLALETVILLPVALLLLGRFAAAGTLAFTHQGWAIDWLLVGSGVVTLVPLILFSAASRLTSLATIGMLQYVAPSLQFLLGVFAFGEPLGRTRLLGFLVAWAGLAVYTFGLWRTARPRAASGLALDGRVLD